MFGLLLPDAVSGARLLPPALRWPALEATVRVVPIELGGSTGTAVCIGHRSPYAYLLTANHVIPDERKAGFEFFRKAEYPKPYNKIDLATVVARSTAADIAIIKVVVGDEAPAVLPLAKPGQRPKRYPFEAVSFGCPARSPPEAFQQTVIAKRLVRQSKALSSVAFYWEMSTTPVGGMSGGPLVDQTGHIIGVCVAHQDNRGYFSHLDEILALLRENSLGWTFDPDEAKTGK
jgi:S1-C subfamily serine protease